MSLNSVLRYFDLYSTRRTTTAEAVSDAVEPTIPWQAQYLALVGGVVIQPFFAYYQQHRVWDLHSIPGWIVFSVIVAFVVFPGVYKRVVDPAKPMIVQLAPIFTAGLGWQSLLATAVSAAS